MAYLEVAESSSFTFDKLLTTAGVIYRDKEPCKQRALTRKVTNHENPRPETKLSPTHSKITPTMEFVNRRKTL